MRFHVRLTLSTCLSVCKYESVCYVGRVAHYRVLGGEKMEHERAICTARRHLHHAPKPAMHYLNSIRFAPEFILPDMSQIVHNSQQAVRSKLGINSIYWFGCGLTTTGSHLGTSFDMSSLGRPRKLTHLGLLPRLLRFWFHEVFHGLISTCNPAIPKCNTHGNRSVRAPNLARREILYSKRNGLAAHKCVLPSNTVSFAVMHQLVDRSSSALCLNEHASDELM